MSRFFCRSALVEICNWWSENKRIPEGEESAGCFIVAAIGSRTSTGNKSGLGLPGRGLPLTSLSLLHIVEIKVPEPV